MNDFTGWGALLVANGQTLLECSEVEDERALDIAGSAVERYADRVLAEREVTESFSHHFGTVILHNLPVTGPLTVTINGETASDYEMWIGRGGLAHVSRTGWPRDVPMDWRAYDQVDLTYTAGFDPLPIDLAQAISYVANGLSEAGAADISRMVIHDVGSISYDTGGVEAWGVIPSTAREMLSAYRRYTG